ncbi:hypothetical protein EDC04DRAFT_2765034 [Pisolithus marmoratus]|nr:hypothetical protein EDC04DRAFT_2765034 [Pisolithus marmoratus]
MYDTLPEPSDDKNDMLDLAFGLSDTSRLGCQYGSRKRWTEWRFDCRPTRNMFVDGKKPTYH